MQTETSIGPRKICYILSYRLPDYVRSKSLIKALRGMSGTVLLEAINSSRGWRRYAETLARLIRCRMSERPDFYVLGFRGYEIFWIVRLLTAGSVLVLDHLRDPHAIQKAMEGNAIVFHLGALISIPYSYQHPREVAETNLMGTLKILLAGRELQVERIVHTSTSEVYGTAQRLPIDESHPLQGQSPYSASKIGADKLVESFYCTYDLPVVTVRPFNTFGPRQSARAVIPTVITQALSQKVIRLGNTETTRDFTFVSDTVDGFIKSAEAENVAGQTFNLGTGVEIKIGDLVELIINKIGGTSKVEVDEQRLRPENSEVLRLISNNRAARNSLGWPPQISLDEGLSRTIAWNKDHLDLYRVGIYEY